MMSKYVVERWEKKRGRNFLVPWGEMELEMWFWWGTGWCMYPGMPPETMWCAVCATTNGHVDVCCPGRHPKSCWYPRAIMMWMACAATWCLGDVWPVLHPMAMWEYVVLPQQEAMLMSMTCATTKSHVGVCGLATTRSSVDVQKLCRAVPAPRQEQDSCICPYCTVLLVILCAPERRQNHSQDLHDWGNRRKSKRSLSEDLVFTV